MQTGLQGMKKDQVGKVETERGSLNVKHRTKVDGGWMHKHELLPLALRCQCVIAS